MLASEGIFIWEDPVCGSQPPPSGKQSDAAASTYLHVNAECWPNPSNGKIFLRFDQELVHGQVKILDATGRIVFANTFEYAGTPLEYDGSAWAQGLLLVQVELVDGGLFSWRVVLQR